MSFKCIPQKGDWEGGDEVLGAPRDDEAIRLGRRETDHIPDAIPPEASIVADDEGIVLSRLHVFERKADGVLFSYFGGRNELATSVGLGHASCPPREQFYAQQAFRLLYDSAQPWLRHP